MPSNVCRFCKEENYKGISLFGIHICKKCEEEIIKIQVDDLKYGYYKSLIKKLWIDHIIEAS